MATKLDRAIKALEASAMPDGRYAHYDDGMRRWYQVDAEDLEDYADLLDDPDESVSGDAYSHWCAATLAEEMPEGWEPDTAMTTIEVGGD
jgi:hypothetical protein